jgi:hypothetical protein
MKMKSKMLYGLCKKVCIFLIMALLLFSLVGLTSAARCNCQPEVCHGLKFKSTGTIAENEQCMKVKKYYNPADGKYYLLLKCVQRVCNVGDTYTICQQYTYCNNNKKCEKVGDTYEKFVEGGVIKNCYSTKYYFKTVPA